MILRGGEPLNTIYLIRHVLPLLASDKHCCIGHSDYPLSLKGKQEIEKVKVFLADKNIEKIFHSPLIRCRRSAEIISATMIPCVCVKDIKEINMGDWEQMSFDKIKIKYPEEYKQRGLDFSGFVPPNGESFAMCLKRGKKAFLEIAAQTKGNAAIVSHAGINRVLICWLRNMNINDIFSIPQPYGCVNIIKENRGEYCVADTGLIPSDLR